MSYVRGIISTFASGVDVIVEWKIDNFFTLPVRDGDCYFSVPFSFGGERWQLGIYPSGSSEIDSYGHLDLRLSKLFSGHKNIKQSFSLSLKTAKGEKYNEQHGTKDFDKYNEVHQFIRFMPRSELKRRRSELIPDSVLTVVLTMKNTPAGSDSEACASGCSTNPHQNRLHYDLKELFLKKEDCDVTIKVEGSEFPAHRVILKARSPVFASTFRHNMKENATGVLEIEDCDPSTFSDFLCFLYCGDVGIISQENVFGLFTAADKYQILDLRANCLEFIKKILTVDTFCETITLALQHSETELIKLSTNYFIKNAPKIVVTVKWQTFLAENPTESNELLVKLLVPDSSSSK